MSDIHGMHNEKHTVVVFDYAEKSEQFRNVREAINESGMQALGFTRPRFTVAELKESWVDALVVLSIKPNTKPRRNIGQEPMLVKTENIPVPRAIVSNVRGAELYVRENSLDAVIPFEPPETLPERVVEWVTSLGLGGVEQPSE